jgi:uroporphyrinogen decarboxylase
MTGKERVIATLEHREPDRVPVGEMGIDYPIIEQVLGHETYYRAKAKERRAIWAGKRDEVVHSQKRDLVDLVLTLKWDFVPVFLTYSDKVDYRPLRFINEHTWEDKEGNIWRESPETGDTICLEPREITREDIARLLQEPLSIDESQFELVRYVVKELGDTHFIIARGWHSPPSWTDGTFPVPGEGLNMRMDDFILRMVDEPQFIHDLLGAYTKRAIEYGKALIAEGVDAVQINADYCYNQGPWVSPRLFREFILPRMKEHCDAFHQEGVYVLKHTDGNSWLLLDMMVEAGIDALHGIQPSIGMDIKELKEKYGQRITLFGAVDCDTLIRGSPVDVVREVEYCLRYGAPGGGFVLTSSNSIQAGVQYENYMVMLKTLREKGIYPVFL